MQKKYQESTGMEAGMEVLSC